jgi:hypothetical protein
MTPEDEAMITGLNMTEAALKKPVRDQDVIEQQRIRIVQLERLLQEARIVISGECQRSSGNNSRM